MIFAVETLVMFFVKAYFLKFQPQKGQKIDWAHIARYGILGSTIYPVGLYYWQDKTSLILKLLTI